MANKHTANSGPVLQARAVVDRSPRTGKGKTKPAVDLDNAVPAGGDDKETAPAIVKAKEPPVPVMSNAVGVVEPLVNPEFATRIPAHSAEEKALLRRLIIEHRGVYEPVLVWEEKNILLDGHNRKEISDVLGWPYPILYVSLPDKNAAIALMCAKQRARRNLTPVQAAYVQGLELLAMASRQGERTDLEAGQNARKWSRAEEIAQKFGIDERTARRKAKFVEGLDLLAEKYDPALRTKALANEIKGVQSAIEQIMKMRTDRQKERAVQQLVETGRLPGRAQQATARTPLARLRAAWDKVGEDVHREFLQAIAAETEFVEMLRAVLRDEDGEQAEDRPEVQEADEEHEADQQEDGQDDEQEADDEQQGDEHEEGEEEAEDGDRKDEEDDEDDEPDDEDDDEAGDDAEDEEDEEEGTEDE